MARAGSPAGDVSPRDHGPLGWREVHPYLDPYLAENHPEIYRSLFHSYQAIRDDDEAYNTFLNRMLYPPEMERPFDSNRIGMAYYLNEAGRYIEALLELLPRRLRAKLRPLGSVTECNDLRRLLGMVFDVRRRRRAFEAQRKIHLANLFFDVEHTWEIQRGEVHQEFLESLMKRHLFKYTVGEQDVDIAFSIAADGLAIDYKVGRSRPDQEAWRFRLRELNLPVRGRRARIHVYFYSCRSKREVLPYRYVRGQKVRELHTVQRWTKLSLRRDASIISKMLRTGISDPGAIPDILGIMFIVKNVAEVEHLKQVLFDFLGGPLKIRNVVDTLSRKDDKALLNPYSGAGYRVYKGDIDMLYREEGEDSQPYSFVVELQIYTLESYLRTIHTRHYANHQRLKKRQFIEGLAPRLFPEMIYGIAPGRAK